MNTKFLTPRLGALAGLIGSTGFAALWIVAALVDGDWVLGQMTLSELGDRSRDGALFFNAGAILVGVLGTLFAIGLYRLLSTSLLGRVGSALMAGAAILLVGIGLFPIDTGLPHTFFSYSFFLVAAVALATLIVPIGRSHVLHLSGGLVSAILLGVGLLGVVLLNKASAEALAVGCLLLWMALMSVRMLWHHPAA